MIRGARRLVAVLCFLMLSGLLPATALGQAPGVPSFSSQAFVQVWARTDWPVAAGQVQRTFYFGPSVALTCQESYKEAPGSIRLVSYLDKARLELNNPASGVVTGGLLAKELISGKMQFGDNEFRAYPPAEVPVAGDPTDSPAPTYASFGKVASINAGEQRAAARLGQTVTETLSKAGDAGTDAGLARYGVTLAAYREELGHNIPNIFMDFFNRRGPVATLAADGSMSVGEDLLIDWVQVMGLPIAEPYWAVVPVGGASKWVLMQPFERRVVTYTPDNAPAFQVEMGNIGQHYKTWRHPDGTCTDRAVPAPPPPAPIEVSVAPGSGTSKTEFTFVIKGAAPDEDVLWGFIDPKKNVWTPRSGARKLPAQVSFSLVPSQAFSRVEKGEWVFFAREMKSERMAVATFVIK